MLESIGTNIWMAILSAAATMSATRIRSVMNGESHEEWVNSLYSARFWILSALVVVVVKFTLF